MMIAAKTLALTAIDLFNDPSVCGAASAELLKRRGEGFKYQSLMGDRQPLSTTGNKKQLFRHNARFYLCTLVQRVFLR